MPAQYKDMPVGYAGFCLAVDQKMLFLILDQETSTIASISHPIGNVFGMNLSQKEHFNLFLQ